MPKLYTWEGGRMVPLPPQQPVRQGRVAVRTALDALHLWWQFDTASAVTRKWAKRQFSKANRRAVKALVRGDWS